MKTGHCSPEKEGDEECQRNDSKYTVCKSGVRSNKAVSREDEQQQIRDVRQSIQGQDVYAKSYFFPMTIRDG
jgi:hypothetical protein